MRKKKLLFVIPEYSHGGTNKSLENLLHFIDKEKYEVNIFSLYEDGGRLYKDIFAPYVVGKSLLYRFAHDNKLTRKVMGLAMKLSKKVTFDWLYKKEANSLQRKYHFDTIIAFQEGAATEFVSYIEHCKNKIAWIHFDYAMIKDEIDLRERMRFYDKYSHIVCVSQAALDSMLEIQPEYKNVSSFIYNTIDTCSITEQANKDEALSYYDKNAFNIISIGRFVKIKQFHLIPAIAKDIKLNTNNKFCWYIIGTGPMYNKIMENIETYRVEDCVKVLPAKDNPYPYFKQADLHVCTSTHESFSYTIAESKILHTPVLCNDFSVASEVLDQTTGWICNIEEMSKKISSIIENKNSCYDKMKKSIMSYSYDNKAIIKRFEMII